MHIIIQNMKRIKYTKELLEEAVKDSYSIAETLRKIGLTPVGGSYQTLKKKLIEFNVDFSHFTGKQWNINPKNPVYIKKFLPKLCKYSSLSSSNVKTLVYRLGLKHNQCELCGISEWQGKPIICELHHINGNSTDNRIENLKILCPNCHSQTDNFRSRNRVKV